jgi:hypothetical protein
MGDAAIERDGVAFMEGIFGETKLDEEGALEHASKFATPVGIGLLPAGSSGRVVKLKELDSFLIGRGQALPLDATDDIDGLPVLRYDHGVLFAGPTP